MTDPTPTTDPVAAGLADPDTVAAMWLAEDRQANHLAEIRAQLDNETHTNWLHDAKAKEQTRKRLEAIRQQRQTTQPPPPQAAEPAQQVNVHHSFDPQPTEPQRSGGGLYLAARLVGFLIPTVLIVGAFIILITSAVVLDKPDTPTQRARNTVTEHQWTCDDATTIEALTVDDNNVLWHWITPVGPCDQLTVTP